MKEYIAKKVSSAMKIDDDRWNSVELAKIDHVWEEFAPTPYVSSARMVHSDEGITVLLTSTEWPLVVKTFEHNGTVCTNSCLEFFFIPNMDDPEYINMEMNPAAIALVAKGPDRGNRPRLNIRGENVKIQAMTEGEQGWRVMAFISYEFLLKHYSHCDKTMRANFYKCGNDTVIPHFSSWNTVPTPKPDYHRPEFFGKIILSEQTI